MCVALRSPAWAWMTSKLIKKMEFYHSADANMVQIKTVSYAITFTTFRNKERIQKVYESLRNCL